MNQVTIDFPTPCNPYSFELKTPERCKALRQKLPKTHVDILTLWYRNRRAWRRAD